MNKVLFSFLLLLSFTFQLKAEKLFPDAQVSLITCAPGKDFYEVFGHCAIRIKDPERKMDVAYNYGVFDFDRPDFYANFAKGHLIYMLGAWDFGMFYQEYAMDNRNVVEQVLDLTPEEKQSIYDYLENNNLPQNREYVYDYFYNNCATKPRDVIEQTLHGHIHYDYSYAAGTSYTIRDLVNHCANRDSWGDLGIDLCLGSVIDKKATPYQYMFLPEYLMRAMALAKIDSNGVLKPLVIQTHYLYRAHPEPPSPIDWTSPLHVFLAIFILVLLITAFSLYKGRRLYFIDTILFGLVGLMGCVLFYISYFTNHHAQGNYNLLWAFPLDFVAGILLLFPRLRKWMRYYFIAAGLVMTVLLIFWKILPQDMNYTIIPILLALLVRCDFVAWMERKTPIPGERFAKRKD